MFFSPRKNGLTAISWTDNQSFSKQFKTDELLKHIRAGAKDRQTILQLIRDSATDIEAQSDSALPARFFPNDFRALLGSPRLLDDPVQPLGIQLKCLGDDFVYEGENMGLFADQPGSVGEVESMSLLLGWDEASAQEREARKSNSERFIFAYTVCYELGHNGAFLSPPTPVSALRFASASGIKSGPRSLGIGSVWYVSESDNPNLDGDKKIDIALYNHAESATPKWERSSTIEAEYYGDVQKNRTAGEYINAVGGVNNTHLRNGCVIALVNAGANNGKNPEQQLSAGNRIKVSIEGISQLSAGFSNN